jgi:hypothetical protein
VDGAGQQLRAAHAHAARAARPGRCPHAQRTVERDGDGVAAAARPVIAVGAAVLPRPSHGEPLAAAAAAAAAHHLPLVLDLDVVIAVLHRHAARRGGLGAAAGAGAARHAALRALTGAAARGTVARRGAARLGALPSRSPCVWRGRGGAVRAGRCARRAADLAVVWVFDKKTLFMILHAPFRDPYASSIRR